MPRAGRSLAAELYAGRIATHYDVLGVPSDAPSSVIRAAYRDRARLHHPDRSGADAVGSAEMAAINEAYRVLGEPGRRALYDRSLGAPTSESAAPSAAGFGSDRSGDERFDDRVRSSHLSPAGPARVPWKLMLVTALLGSAVVLVSAAFDDPPSTEPPDGIIRAGSCVQIEPNGDAREIACTNTPADVVVELLVPTLASCPAGMAAHRDRLGLGTACIRFD